MTNEALCPYCQKPLKKQPKRKTKCPHCGEFMLVRGGKSYTEKQVKENDFLRFWLYCLEQHHGVSEDEFQERRKDLSKQFGFRASANDTIWSILNEQVTKVTTYPNNHLRTIYIDMAIFLREEGKDYSGPVKSANKVQSDFIKEDIHHNQQLSGSFPGSKWKFHAAPDDRACPCCREAAQKDLSVSEAVNVPLNCTSRYGCRCGVYLHLEPINPETVQGQTREIPRLDEQENDKRPWWKFWK